MKTPLKAFILTAGLCLSACVNIDPTTGDTIPRGNQHHTFDYVTERVDKLRPGMTQIQVLSLLGSPAEKSRSDDTWVYLPERPAVLIPGRALMLQFERGRLKDHGYHAIILGARF